MKLPRFSLLTLLLLTTIAAMAITIAMLYREVGPLRTEVKQLRDETGQLTIDDPELVHAIRIPTADDQPRRYRVYLPPGGRYSLHYQVNEIPSSGVPDARAQRDLAAGEYVVSVELNRQVDRKTGAPIPAATAEVEVQSTDPQQRSKSSYVIGISESQNDWIVNDKVEQMTYSWQEIGRQVETFQRDRPLVLYRALAYDPIVEQRSADGRTQTWSSITVAADDGPCDGFMVWIETTAEE